MAKDACEVQSANPENIHAVQNGSAVMYDTQNPDAWLTSDVIASDQDWLAGKIAEKIN